MEQVFIRKEDLEAMQAAEKKEYRYDLARVFAEALLKAREIQRLRDRSTGVDAKAVAKEAVAHADALIEELAK